MRTDLELDRIWALPAGEAGRGARPVCLECGRVELEGCRSLSLPVESVTLSLILEAKPPSAGLTALGMHEQLLPQAGRQGAGSRTGGRRSE